KVPRDALWCQRVRQHVRTGLTRDLAGPLSGKIRPVPAHAPFVLDVEVVQLLLPGRVESRMGAQPFVQGCRTRPLSAKDDERWERPTLEGQGSPRLLGHPDDVLH